MNNVPMRFKDFEFLVNPQKIEIKAAANLKQIAVPFDSFELQEFGVMPLVVSGQGELVGKNSKQDFERLLALFLRGGAGPLFISGTQPMMAIMTKLVKSLDSFEDMISYSFEFVQVPQKQVLSQDFERYHTITDKENLWKVANLYDVPVEEILEKNEYISNPWDVKNGDRVRVL